MRILPDATIEEMLARATSQAAREDIERLVGEIRRLRGVLTDEAKHRGYWAGEASRLLDVVERGSQLRSAMVAEAIRNEREACAKVAEDTLVDGLILEGVRFGSSVRAAIVAAIRARE